VRKDAQDQGLENNIRQVYLYFKSGQPGDYSEHTWTEDDEKHFTQDDMHNVKRLAKKSIPKPPLSAASYCNSVNKQKNSRRKNAGTVVGVAEDNKAVLDHYSSTLPGPFRDTVRSLGKSLFIFDYANGSFVTRYVVIRLV
jgi:hypothetical protein